MRDLGTPESTICLYSCSILTLLRNPTFTQNWKVSVCLQNWEDKCLQLSVARPDRNPGYLGTRPRPPRDEPPAASGRPSRPRLPGLRLPRDSHPPPLPGLRPRPRLPRNRRRTERRPRRGLPRNKRRTDRRPRPRLPRNRRRTERRPRRGYLGTSAERIGGPDPGALRTKSG